MGALSKLVRGLGWLWIGIATLVNVAIYAMIFFKQGFWALQDALSPFNFRNYITVGITFAPGAVLVMLADAIQRRQTRKALGLLGALPVAAILVVFLFYAANATRASKTHASESTKTREYKAVSARVLRDSAVMHEHKDYGITFVSRELGKDGIPETFKLDDVITVKGRTLRVRHIFVTEIKEDMKWGGKFLAKKGDVQCMVVESEDNLPYDEAKRSRLWIFVPYCQPITIQ